MATRYLVSCTGCPFHGKYRSRGTADYAFGRHSCDRYQRRAAEAIRYVERNAAIDRTPKPCHHKQADHQHGTYACYVLDACKCLPCGTANRTYEADRTRQQAYGRWNGLVDAEPARQHIRALMAQGMGLKRIAAVSGVAHGVLWKLIYGKRKRLKSGKPSKRRTPSRRVRPETEARILATKVDLADGARVDGFGAARRVQALVALGWSMAKIAARLGIQRSNFTSFAHGRTDISVAHDKAVRALYAELSMQLPPQESHRDKIAASRSRNLAKALGWLPPLAWDDESLDDPNAGPGSRVADDELDQSAIERRIGGDKSVPLTAGERAELVRRMLAKGFTKRDIERNTGVNPYRDVRTPEGVSA